jgi:aryl-alcohol dehydrogenase-like predicted oxidoreductase
MSRRVRAYDRGINYFDNSAGYWVGKSEEIYGAILPPFREHFFLTTKANSRTRAGAEAELSHLTRQLFGNMHLRIAGLSLAAGQPRLW